MTDRLPIHSLEVSQSDTLREHRGIDKFNVVAGSLPSTKIAVVPDVHGCLRQLTQAMALIDSRTDVSKVVFLGDYVDRGPDSKGVLDLLISRDPAKNVFLLGNHDDMFAAYLYGARTGHWEQLWGYKTLESFDGILDEQQWPGALDKYRDFYKNTCLTHYETEHHVFVHAAVNPHKSMAEQERDYMLWGREMFCYSDFGKTVVTGHSIVPAPTLLRGQLALDCGCYTRGALAVAFLEENSPVTPENLEVVMVGEKYDS